MHFVAEKVIEGLATIGSELRLTDELGDPTIAIVL